MHYKYIFLILIRNVPPILYNFLSPFSQVSNLVAKEWYWDIFVFLQHLESTVRSKSATSVWLSDNLSAINLDAVRRRNSQAKLRVAIRATCVLELSSSLIVLTVVSRDYRHQRITMLAFQINQYRQNNSAETRKIISKFRDLLYKL